MAEGVHGGGLWSCAMTNARVHGIHDWLSKAPSGTQEPYRQPLSRHWQGADLNKPKPYYGQGRRETDVREACHWRTARAPDAGQLMLRRAPRGAHRAIHGGTDAEMLPAEAVIYSGPSIPRGSPPPPLPPPPEREGGPCFYMGEMLSERPVNGGIIEQGRSEWRAGDTRRFTLDGSVPNAQSSSEWREGEPGGSEGGHVSLARHAPVQDGQPPGASLVASFVSGTQAPNPRTLLHGDFGRREGSDLHDGEQGARARPDPPPVPRGAFCRSASDVTLHSGGAAQRAMKRAGRHQAGALAGMEEGEVETGGFIFDEEFDSLAAAAAAANGGVAYGRRRTEITMPHAAPSVLMSQHGNLNGTGEVNAEYRHQTTDLHLDNMDRAFRARDAADKMVGTDAGRPKYGRRRYPLTLFSADYDLLKV